MSDKPRIGRARSAQFAAPGPNSWGIEQVVSVLGAAYYTLNGLTAVVGP